MKTNKEMRQIIEDEILVDCYGDDEVNMAWFYYMEENMIFPFDAQLEVKKRDGSKELKEVEVLRLASTERDYAGEDFRVEVAYSEDIIETSISKLHHIKADEGTLEAIQIWKFWNKS